MEVDELQRRQLFNDLDRAIGPDSAAVLMTYLPPAGWADLATKGDLDVARSETKAEFASVRREIASLRAEMTAGFEILRETVAQGCEIVGTGLTADFRKEMVDMTHKLYFAVAGLLVGLGTLGMGIAAVFR